MIKAYLNSYQQFIVSYSETINPVGYEQLPTFFAGLSEEIFELFDELHRFESDKIAVESGDVLAYMSLVLHLYGVELGDLVSVDGELEEHNLLLAALAVMGTLKRLSRSNDGEKQVGDLVLACASLMTVIENINLYYTELDLKAILDCNMNKLEARRSKGTQKGSGER